MKNRWNDGKRNTINRRVVSTAEIKPARTQDGAGCLEQDKGRTANIKKCGQAKRY